MRISVYLGNIPKGLIDGSLEVLQRLDGLKVDRRSSREALLDFGQELRLCLGILRDVVEQPSQCLCSGIASCNATSCKCSYSNKKRNDAHEVEYKVAQLIVTEGLSVFASHRCVCCRRYQTVRVCVAYIEIASLPSVRDWGHFCGAVQFPALQGSGPDRM